MGVSSASIVSYWMKKVLKTAEVAVKEEKKKEPIKKVAISSIKPLVFSNSGTAKVVNQSFENFSRTYINNEPEMLFAAEYIVDGKIVGVLVAWERFYDSTHYEVYKQNIFKENAKFERILFIDTKSLEEESKYYHDYLEKNLGIRINRNNTFVIMDPLIKDDRIYEYKIKAARVPKAATEVDYDFIMESKNLVKSVVVDSLNKNNLFDFAASNLGSKDLAWTISLLNESVPFFGRDTLEKPLGDYLSTGAQGQKSVFVANNLNDIVSIMNDSFFLFEEKNTFSHLLRVLGGLGTDFRNSFLESIDETRNVFSFDNFKASIKGKIPIFSIILQIAESPNNKDAVNRLSKLSITVPTNKGSETFSAIENITKIIKFTNEIYISLLYAQDKNTSVEVQKILDDMKKANETKQDTSTNAWTKFVTGATSSVTKTTQTTSTAGSSTAVASGKSTSSNVTNSGYSSSSSGTKTVSSGSKSAKKKTKKKGSAKKK